MLSVLTVTFGWVILAIVSSSNATILMSGNIKELLGPDRMIMGRSHQHCRGLGAIMARSTGGIHRPTWEAMDNRLS
jgi:hypothetical protein